MKETEKVDLFVKAMYTLNWHVVLNESIPKGVVELRIHSEDEENLKKMNNITDSMMVKVQLRMLSDIHTRIYGKDATDRLVHTMMLRTSRLMMKDIHTQIGGKETIRGSIVKWIRRFFS